MDNNEIITPAAEEAVETVAAEAAAETAAPAAETAPAAENASADQRSERTFSKAAPRRRKKVCQFCVDNVDEIDFKEFKSPQKAKAFISERAKILPRRVTGCCARHQRQLTVAIKRARQLALLPYISD